jgi:hypothetical protein
MQQWWLIVGSQENWHIAFELNNIWGVQDFPQLAGLWQMLREGDGLLFYVSKSVHGIVGVGHVVTKFRQTNPLWPKEVEKKQVIWPLRFEFDVEYCLPPSLWKSERYTSQHLQMVTRNVFQCYPIAEVNTIRVALGLRPFGTRETAGDEQPTSLVPTDSAIDHREIQEHLCEIGRIQSYVADREYPLDSMYLDVVWRRVQQSVPTFAFEVQISGDIYQAMAKLKHARDLWNSRIFLASTLSQRSKFQELLSGTFHEVADEMRFLDVRDIQTLLQKKQEYKSMERTLGIVPR